MKLLIVEDSEDVIATFEQELGKRGDIEVSVARSRDRALALIASEMFDFAVVDLKIPPTDGALDSDKSHGLAVHTALSEGSPGTPTLIFSGFGTLRLVQSLLDSTTSHDVWGAGSQHPMTLFLEKGQASKCLALINQVADQVAVLSSVEISFGPKAIDFTYHQQSILRVFARKYVGTNIRVSLLGGGLSEAKTCRIQVEDERGRITCYAVVKLGGITDLRDEYNRYENLVAPILNVGAFAHVIQFLTAGAGATGGLFYGLAKEHDWSLVDALKQTPDSTTDIVARLKQIEVPWQNIAQSQRVPISQIRLGLMSDAAFHDHSHELGFDWAALEKLEVRITECRRHRDLHGLNVLLRSRQEPLLIDFAEVGAAPASLDPLTLELSLLFHPACKDLYPGWPSIAQAQQWDNLDAFTENCPAAHYVRLCRQWAFEVEAGDQGVFATAYSYAVRQLKYPNTDHKLAAAIAEAAARRLLPK
jgi:DNA-binding NarL/FixJ family response regulator